MTDARTLLEELVAAEYVTEEMRMSSAALAAGFDRQNAALDAARAYLARPVPAADDAAGMAKLVAFLGFIEQVPAPAQYVGGSLSTDDLHAAVADYRALRAEIERLREVARIAEPLSLALHNAAGAPDALTDLWWSTTRTINAGLRTALAALAPQP